jgi:hypothetical protein
MAASVSLSLANIIGECAEHYEMSFALSSRAAVVQWSVVNCDVFGGGAVAKWGVGERFYRPSAPDCCGEERSCENERQRRVRASRLIFGLA